MQVYTRPVKIIENNSLWKFVYSFSFLNNESSLTCSQHEQKKKRKRKEEEKESHRITYLVIILQLIGLGVQWTTVKSIIIILILSPI